MFIFYYRILEPIVRAADCVNQCVTVVEVRKEKYQRTSP